MESTEYCQFADFSVVISPMTGRSLRCNTSPTKVHLDSSMHFSAFEPIFGRLKSQLAGRKQGGGGPRLPLVRAFETILASSTVSQMAAGIDQLIVAGKSLETQNGQKCFVLEFLYSMWADGLLAMPTNPIFESKVAIRPGKINYGSLQPICDALLAGSRLSGVNEVIGSFIRIAGGTMGIKQVGDIHPAAIAPALLEVYRYCHIRKLVDALSVLHRAEYGDRIPSREDWGLGRKINKSLEHDFLWVLEEDQAMDEWRSKLREWILGKKHGLAPRTYMANRFFSYLLENPSLPRKIAVYCQRETVLSVSWADWASRQQWSVGSLNNYSNMLSEFIDWYLHVHLTDDDDFGRPVSSPLHWNPVMRLGSAGGRKADTHRDAMPLRYLHELQNIITADDFKWPKTIKKDLFRRVNPITGQVDELWSPVRAYAMLVKLFLPLRTYQVRMLDSGEADSMMLVNGVWVTNTKPLAPKSKKVIRRGFLREFHDTQSGHSFTGFYVNTNKTADLFKDKDDKGYEIPWEHASVIGIASELRDWQSTFNPLMAPTRWADVNDKILLRSNTQEMLVERGEACFLFRDVCGVHPAEPVRDSRLRTFWSLLLQELERRIAARGESLPDGSPLKFVEMQTSNNFPRALYDLHTLRVSLITALAVDGGVPLHILSKCVAGHATILMTMYYTKPGPAHVSEALAAAQQKLQRQEQTNFIRFLQNAEIAAAKPIVAFNDVAALEAAEQCEPSGWSIGEIGICPVSGAKCHEGGPVVVGSPGGRHGPVPGGGRNCVRCRFFVTGPAFLGGLVERFNAIGFRLSEQSDGVKSTELKIQMLEDCVEDFKQGDIAAAYDQRETLLAKIDASANDWHACYALIQRCKEILKSKNGSGVNLVLVGSTSDLETAARECTRFDLIDRICQCSTIYPSDDVPHASIRRAKLIDAMLVRNSRGPLFLTLDDAEVLSVGNAFVSLLAARLNVGDMNALIQGQLTLADSGVQESVDAMLKLQTTHHYSGKSLMDAARKLLVNEVGNGV